MFADFHKVGMTPDLRYRLNKCDKGTDNSFAQICRILDGILSTLGDLWMSSLLRIPCTSNAVVIDPVQKWLPLNYSFVHIRNSPTNLVFETKILKNLLSRTRLVGLF